MRRRIGERIDDLQLLDNRARPSVRGDERQSIVVLRTNVYKINIYSIDLSDELWQGVEFRLALAPVVVRSPITHQLLEFCELYALRLIIDGFPVGPARGGDAPTEIGELLV